MIGILANQKGGVAKTTNTVHLASALANKGFKTLIIDFDPQCDLSHAVGVRNEFYNVVDFLNDKPDFRLKQKSENFFVLPGSKNFISFDFPIDALKKVLYKKRGNIILAEFFDFIFIDAPPSKIISIDSNKKFPPTEVELALFASDFFIIPLLADDFSAKNANTFLGNVSKFITKHKLKLKFLGFFFVRILVTSNSKDFYYNLFERNAQNLLFKSFVRKDAQIEKAQNVGQTIFQFNPNCRAAEDFYDLRDEFLKKINF